MLSHSIDWLQFLNLSSASNSAASTFARLSWIPSVAWPHASAFTAPWNKQQEKSLLKPHTFHKFSPNASSKSTSSSLCSVPKAGIFSSLYELDHLFSLNPVAIVLSFFSLFCASIWTRNDPQNPQENSPYDKQANNNLLVGSCCIPHDDKRHKGGEDTFFVSQDLKTIGVFDGVGGWSNVGIDPREYSLSLALSCKLAVDEKSLAQPLEILRYGYDASKHIVGSSTACIVAIMDGNQFLSANLGDSGFRIVRHNQIVLASESQQHRFNMPFQLGCQSDDLPEMSSLQQFTLEPGDYIILGTDGLFDNLYDKDILKVIQNQPEGVSMPTLARAIAQRAYEVSKLEEVKIPFNDMAAIWGINFWENGKQDDITVIAARYLG